MRWELLAPVPDEDVRELLAVARIRRFDRNEVVFHHGDPASSLHLVRKGRFAVRITTPLGDTATLDLKGPGDAFGELALVSGGSVRSATVSALEPAETYAVDAVDFDRVRRRHPAVNEILVALLAGQVRRLSERLVEALYVPADRRVLRRLRDLAEVYGGEGTGAVVPLPQEDIAALAGTSRATVNRVLRAEERRGTVELARGRTVVVDPAEFVRRAR